MNSPGFLRARRRGVLTTLSAAIAIVALMASGATTAAAASTDGASAVQADATTDPAGTTPDPTGTVPGALTPDLGHGVISVMPLS